ncbi:MAG: hypothetical protein HQM16_11055 [Deltaproteobacteria bacterium]|nr:hypothetical protein [Deltaproteobacteria bacterium]
MGGFRIDGDRLELQGGLGLQTFAAGLFDQLTESHKKTLGVDSLNDLTALMRPGAAGPTIINIPDKLQAFFKRNPDMLVKLQEIVGDHAAGQNEGLNNAAKKFGFGVGFGEKIIIRPHQLGDITKQKIPFGGDPRLMFTDPPSWSLAESTVESFVAGALEFPLFEKQDGGSTLRQLRHPMDELFEVPQILDAESRATWQRLEVEFADVSTDLYGELYAQEFGGPPPTRSAPYFFAVSESRVREVLAQIDKGTSTLSPQLAERLQMLRTEWGTLHDKYADKIAYFREHGPRVRDEIMQDAKNLKIAHRRSLQASLKGVNLGDPKAVGEALWGCVRDLAVKRLEREFSTHWGILSPVVESPPIGLSATSVPESFPYELVAALSERNIGGLEPLPLDEGGGL